jgi:hypothetical protein
MASQFAASQGRHSSCHALGGPTILLNVLLRRAPGPGLDSLRLSHSEDNVKLVPERVQSPVRTGKAMMLAFLAGLWYVYPELDAHLLEAPTSHIILHSSPNGATSCI